MSRLTLILLFAALSTPALGKRATIKWDPLANAAKYSVEISNAGKVFATETTQETSIKKTLPPGSYSFRVRAIDKQGIEGQWTESRDILIPLEKPVAKPVPKEPPPRKIASTQTPPATVKETVTQNEKRPSLFLDLNSAILPYLYSTKNSASPPAQGFSTELSVRYRVADKWLGRLRMGGTIQTIDEIHYTTKSLDLGAEYETGTDFVISGGIGVRAMDWFHLTRISGHDNLATFGPTAFAGVKKPLGKFSIGAHAMVYLPVSISWQSNIARPWALRGTTLNFEPGVVIGYAMTKSLTINGGVTWLPRHLNLSNDDFIKNEGTALSLGGHLTF